MKRISEVDREDLKWTIPFISLGKFWELKTKENVVATLQWEKMFDSSVIGETAYGKWILKRVGGHKYLKLLPEGIDACPFQNDSIIVAKLRFKTRSISVNLRSETTYQIQFAKVMLNFRGIAFLDSGNSVVSFRPRKSVITKKVWVETTISDQFVKSPELSLLLLMGGFIIIRYYL